MKTQPLRQQQNCLNCGNDVPTRFCGYCGQENIVPHETFGHLVKHFVADIFHYDSQFFLTIKYLFTKPGLLSREYREGKRARYMNPIKLYVFTSFFFFFIYLTWQSPEAKSAKVHTTEAGPQAVQLGHTDELWKLENKLKDGVERHDSGAIRNMKLLEMIAASTSLEEFDSIHQQLPDSLQFSFWMKLIARADARSLKSYSSNEERERAYGEGYYHNFPKIMILCLPLFAYFLKLIYFRNKQWFYVDHVIFTLHFHAFAFIVTAVLLPVIPYFYGWFGNGTLFYQIFACIMAGYLIIAMRRNYEQSIWKSAIKGIILYAVYLTSLKVVLLSTALFITLYHTYF
ncbi:MAG: DUF3667 domain-containing protein [Chitinophaga sp.]|uniref:DUF3667 domain-containing protein n=1 Tax=Chitinophaga sp. TaxID=1869181 RepID=UPI0025B9E332|nr:DUF3667 domain-containing protein [Chitinophaga sp.]MBV8251828.1 DUF3667 domain-containing protein [Chitinophaga sp.]